MAHVSKQDGLLQLLLVILQDFNNHQLLYCYWKSNQRVREVLAGRADLDLLIARADQHRAQAILLNRGLKLFPEVAGRDDPAILSYFGYDEPSGLLVHLHIHFGLMLGTKLFKNYRLPWEATILDRAVFHPDFPIRVLDPETEALLLVTRAAVEWNRTDPVALRHWAVTKRKFEFDRQSLANRLDRAALREQVGKIFTGDLTNMIVDAFFCSQPLECHSRLKRRIRKALAEHRAYSAAESLWRGWGRNVRWLAGNLNKYFFHTPRPWNRHAPGGGRIIAVVGIDGSGKSTVVAAIKAWLGAEVDVIPVYFGTGDGRPSLVLAPLKILVPLATRVLKTKRRGVSHESASERPHGLLYALAMMIWAAVVAVDKRTKLQATHRAASRGLVVITDRYPQDGDLGYNDGPLLPRLLRAPCWLRRFEAVAYARARRRVPDLMIQLEVAPETGARREPEINPAIIRQRIAALHSLTFGGARIVRVNAERPLPEVLHAVKREIWALL